MTEDQRRLVLRRMDDATKGFALFDVETGEIIANQRKTVITTEPDEVVIVTVEFFADPRFGIRIEADNASDAGSNVD